MDEDLQAKIYEEVSGLKDLFLRRLLDDKVKVAAINQLKENNEALLKQLDDRSTFSMVKEILLVCDRIDAIEEVDDLTASVEEELLEILARRDFRQIPPAEFFDPLCHNAVGTVEETPEYPEKSIVRVVRNGYFYRDRVFRSAGVIVAIKGKASDQLV